MAYSQYINDPILQRLNQNYLKLCSDADDGKDVSILKDGCFKVVSQSKVVLEFCALQGLAYPVDTANLITMEILPGESLELFNNHTEDYVGDPLPTDKSFVRAVLVWIQYPTLDNNGDNIEPEDLISTLTITNQALVSFSTTLGQFFSHFSNPVTTVSTQILNSITVTNPSAIFPICVKALLVYTKTDDAQNNPCNC